MNNRENTTFFSLMRDICYSCKSIQHPIFENIPFIPTGLNNLFLLFDLLHVE